jgi:hypothetical protein
MRHLVLLAFLCSGCDTLFPEFFGSGGDAGAVGDGAMGDGAPAVPAHISGQVCALTDVRDYRSCAATHGGSFRLSIEETRDQAQADATGVFSITTSAPLATGTLAAVDATGQYSPTVTLVHPIGGALDRFALPVVAVVGLQELAMVNGFAVDAARGALLAWAVDAQGTPIAGVRASAITGAQGPFYDGANADGLEPGAATGQHGLVAQFDLPPGNVALTLSPPAGAAVHGDTFQVPIRAGALTLLALTLPAN